MEETNMVHRARVEKLGFQPAPSPEGFSSCWKSYASKPGGAIEGSYHICAPLAGMEHLHP